MNRERIARELLKVAKDLVAVEDWRLANDAKWAIDYLVMEYGPRLSVDDVIGYMEVRLPKSKARKIVEMGAEAYRSEMGRRVKIVASRNLISARRWDFGKYEAEDDDGYHWLPDFDASDAGKLDKALDQAIKKNWDKALKQIEANPGEDAEKYLGDPSPWPDSGFVGKVFDSVSDVVQDISLVYTGRGGDADSREDFELNLYGQLQEFLYADVKALNNKVREDMAKRSIEDWNGVLLRSNWS